MAIGARDNIDRELVRKYAKLKMDNPETTKLIDSQTMLAAMNDIANMQWKMMVVKENLKDLCSNVTSKSVKYMRINFNPPRRR